MAKGPIHMNSAWPLLALALALLLALSPAYAEKCTYEVNVNYRGSDMNDGRSHIVDKWEDCCEDCAETPGCKSWTFLKDPTKLTASVPPRLVGECWLKRGFKPGYSKNEPCCISGVVVYTGQDI